MKAVILVVFVLTVAAVLCLLEAYREQQYFKVTEDVVVSRRLNGLKKEKKIVFLSDLHNKEYGAGNERLLDAICKARPDLILFGGDMLVGKKGCSFAPALEFVSKLPAIAPVYYACGNHEQRMKRKPEVYGEVYQEYQKQLEECGVHFLENSSVLLKEDDCRIRISALELPLATYTKFKKYRVTEQDVTACIEKEAADYEILLAHNPVYFDAYKKWGADLVLSGHLHGGIIRLPGIGGLITPQAIPFPKYSGEMTTEGEQTIIVSRGLGTHTINLRFLNEAEMIVIHLRGEKDS